MRKRILLGSLVATLACSGGGGGGTGSGGQGTGGQSTGGAAPTGGATNTGGGTATGGTSTGGRAGGTGGTATGGAVTGGAGGSSATGGRAATGGVGGGSGTGGSTTPKTDVEGVYERNKHPSRDAHYIQPKLTKAAAAKMAMDTDFKATFTGPVWGQVLYAENVGGKGMFVVATGNNDVFALDETTGAQLWTKNLGTPAGKTGVSCGGIAPIGVVSTPVIDSKTNTLYVAGATGTSSAITAHYLAALDLKDGSVKAGYPIDLAKAAGFSDKVAAHNQRSALSIVGSIVYVAYGGHIGDCDTYHGRVVAVDTSMNPPVVKAWATGGVGEAIWAPAGMASSGDGVFAATGNRTSGSGAHNDSEEIAHVRGMGTLDKTGTKDVFFPSDWMTKDQRDADLGAMNPLLVNLPGITAPALVIVSKDGNGFVLDSSDLGKTPAATFTIATGVMTVHGLPTTYVAGGTTFYTVNIDNQNYMGCPAGTMGSGGMIMGVALAPSSPLKPTVTWCHAYALTPAASDEMGTFRAGAMPTGLISTTTDGSTDALVWYMNGGTKLMALDGATGEVVFNGGNDTCTGVHKWNAPIAVKGRIIMAGDGKLCSWSPH